MVVRNGERFIADALRSIEAQTLAASEIVLVDGHSSDDTVAIARGCAGVRVTLQRGPTLSDAYNEGVAAARGELIAFLSYDDTWPPRKLEIQCARLRAEPPADACIGLVEHVIEPQDVAPSGFRRELLGAPRAARLMELLMLPRTTWERVGPMRPDCGTAGDVDWFARAGDLGVRFAVVPEVLLRKRVHGLSSAHTDRFNAGGILQALHDSVLRKRDAESMSP